jgi:hypothetical protein
MIKYEDCTCIQGQIMNDGIIEPCPNCDYEEEYETSLYDEDIDDILEDLNQRIK